MTTHRAALLIALVASLAAGSAEADPGRLTGIGADLFGNSFFHFGAPNLKGFAVSGIEFGKLHVQLQRTRLEDVQHAFGGTIFEEGQGTGVARWLCYESPQSTTWLMSNSLGGGEFIMMVAQSAGPSGGSCDPAPADFPAAQFGIPGLGASVGELKERFGSATLGSHSDVSYRADRPAKDGLGTANDAQYIGYVVRGGTIIGIGVGETTTQ